MRVAKWGEGGVTRGEEGEGERRFPGGTWTGRDSQVSVGKSRGGVFCTMSSQRFHSRLSKLYAQWNEQKSSLNDADVLAVITGTVRRREGTIRRGK